MSASFPVPPGVRPGGPGAAGPDPAWPEPYRILFPLGGAFALAGALPWALAVLVPGAWPGPLHITLMIEGFEQSFMLGFLLTAMPAFTRGGRCSRGELATAVALMAVFAALALGGLAWAAHLAFGASALLIAWALGSRVARTRHLPPEEFSFVALGILFGLAGVAVLVAQGAFGQPPPAPRFGERLISLGMTLSVVLGVGGLLVPTFAGMRDPLGVPGVARPHERAGRRRLFALVALALIGAFVLEAWGHAGAGALTRAAGASVMLLLVWKVFRGPGQRGVLARALWTSGWLVLGGLWLAVGWPSQATTAYHLMFVGGYGLLTLGIGSRVTVAHGRHPFADESRLLTPWVLGALALALVLRLAAPLSGAGVLHAYAASAAFWMLAWALWAAAALPRILRTVRPAAPGPVVQLSVPARPGAGAPHGS